MRGARITRVTTYYLCDLFYILNDYVRFSLHGCEIALHWLPQRITNPLGADETRINTDENRGCGTTVAQTKEVIKKRLLTTKEAATYLGMSDWSIRQLVKSGRLPVVSGCEECNWKFDVHDLDEFIENNKQWNGDGQ